MKTNTNTEELLKGIQKEWANRLDDVYLTDYQVIELAPLIDQYVHQKTIEARMQMKVNVWQQFKTQMDLQSLSTLPTDGSRFRTPLEELTIILENQVPLAEFQATLNTEKEQ
jgi:hypothetical protein